MSSVYLLYENAQDLDDWDTLLGVYSTRERAEQALERYTLPLKGTWRESDWLYSIVEVEVDADA